MRINEIWPDLQIGSEISKGSYGTVYKCFSQKNGIKEYSAVKVISVPKDEVEVRSITLEGMTSEQTKEYFKDIVYELLNEVKILETLKGNRNIVRIYDSAVAEKEDGIGWQVFIKMELLTDFNAYTSDKQLTENEAINLGLDLCNALSACKDKKIIHRDIKPENIFIDENGNFKLGDFGVSKQLEKTEDSLSKKGTYNYMAPEVFHGEHYDSRADIYSLGIVLYKVLNNNRLPFIDVNKQLIMHSEREAAFERRINGEPIPPINNASSELNAVVLKACQFKAEDRFKDVDEFSESLKALKKGKKLNFIIPTKVYKRKRFFAVIAAIIAVSIVSTAIGYFLGNNKVVSEKNTESSDSHSTSADYSTIGNSENLTSKSEVLNTFKPDELYRPPEEYFCNQYKAYVYCTDNDIQDFVKMRYGPDKNKFSVIKEIDNYTNVIVETTSFDGWTLCYFDNDEGWIRSDFIFEGSFEN